MINKVGQNNCTICQACKNICPKEAIKLEKNIHEYSYPIIDMNLCINCGKCEKACPVLKPLEGEKKLKKLYSAKNINEDIRENSSSGGVFTALAEEIISKSGVVYGAAFDEDFKVRHIGVEDKEGLKKLRGSKYIQSNMNNSYIKIKKNLLLGKQVLFSGCPCQVAGLKRFLEKEYENLFTVDFICHGIPSQKIFDEYIKILEEMFNSKLKSFEFRNKEKGWHNSSVRAVFQNGKIYTRFITEDMYMRGFLTSIYLKESCYNCQFREFKSGSDITLADFWGAELEAKDIDDNKGLSVIIVNRNKGKLLLDRIKKSICIREENFEKVIRYNQSLLYSSKPNINREKFYSAVERLGYKKAFYKYCKEDSITKLKRVTRGKLGAAKRKILK